MAVSTIVSEIPNFGFHIYLHGIGRGHLAKVLPQNLEICNVGRLRRSRDIDRGTKPMLSPVLSKGIETNIAVGLWVVRSSLAKTGQESRSSKNRAHHEQVVECQEWIGKV